MENYVGLKRDNDVKLPGLCNRFSFDRNSISKILRKKYQPNAHTFHITDLLLNHQRRHACNRLSGPKQVYYIMRGFVIV